MKAAVAAAAVLVLGAATLLALGDGIARWEEALLAPVNDLPDGLRPVIGPVMQLGTFFAPFVVAAVAWAVTRRPRPAADVVIAGLVGYWSALVVKALVERERPGVLLDGVVVRDPSADGYGFVSGHATVAFAIAAALSPWLPRWGRVAAFTTAAVVAASRLYEGVHLPLDLIGGAALGLLSALAARMLLDRVDASPTPPDPPHPPRNLVEK